MPVPVFTAGETLDASEMNAVGLWRVTGCTVSSAGGTAATASNGVITVGTNNTSVTVNNAFSADYDSYLIAITGGTTGSGNNLDLQLSGITGTSYSTAGYFMTYGTATVNAYAPAAATSWLVGQVGTANTSIFITITNPAIAKQKGMATSSMATSNYSFTGQCTSTSTASGFQIFANAGQSLTGQKIRVYGYRN